MLTRKEESIEKRDFDVFNTWNIKDQTLSLPQRSSVSALVEEDKLDPQTFWIENEFRPLVEQAANRGIDVSDKKELISYFVDQGLVREANFLRNRL